MAIYRNSSSNGHSSSVISQNTVMSLLKRNAGYTMAGFLIIGGLIGAVVTSNDSSNVHTNSEQDVKIEGAKPMEAAINNETSVETDAAEQSQATGNSLNVSSNSVNGQSSTTVEVNGQSVPVPSNGSTTQTIDNGNGQVQVNISNNQSSSTSSKSRTSINVHSSNDVKTKSTGGGSVSN